MKKDPHGFHQAALIVFRFSVYYFLLAVAALYMSPQSGNIATLWFANAFGIAYVVCNSKSLSTGLLLGAALATLFSHLALGDTMNLSLAFVPANVAEIWLAVFLIRHAGCDMKFDQGPENFVRLLVLAICIPALVGASLGTSALWLYGMQPYSRIWSSWYAGTTIGSIALLPIAILAMRMEWSELLRRIDLRKTILWAAISTATGVFALGNLPHPFIYIMTPLTVSAVLLSFESVAVLVCLSAIVTGGAIAAGHFAPLAAGDVSVWQTYIPFLLTMVPPLLMASGMNQSRVREAVRLQVEDELKRSAQDLRTIIDHTPAMIGYWDRDLKNRFGNSAYVEWFGLTQEQMRDRHIREILGEQRYALNLPYIKAALRGESPIFEREIVDQQGNTRHVLASYVPDIVDGETKGFYAFVNDITSLTQARREQGAAQAQLQSIIDAASEFSIIATGVDGTIRVFSPGAERMLGYRAAELVGKATPVVLHLEEELSARREALTAELGRQLADFDIFTAKVQTDRADVCEWTYRRKDGTCLPVRLVVTAMHGADGCLIGYLGIAKDISQQRQLQSSLVKARDEAEAASRAKSEFVANMSHEIRTPLNAVLGMAHLLGNTPLSKEQRDYLDMLRDSGRSLLGILNDILDFSKIEAGRMDLTSEPFDLGDVLNAVANIMTINAGERELELAIGMGLEVPTQLIGDALRLQQILINLAGNAIKFTEHGEVSLLVERNTAGDAQGEDVSLRFIVRDTGIGMDPEQQEKVFSAFSQADSSTTRRFGGTGLGLAICKRLVALMKGQMHVRSAIGAGSEFSVTIPLKIAAYQGTHGQTDSADLKLLVIDDNATSREYLCRTGRALRLQMDTAASAEKGIELVAAKAKGRDPYDLVLLDWHMADGEGFAIMEAIRASTPLPMVPRVAIMVSAFGRGKLIGDKQAAQADAILVKPLTRASLLAVLQVNTREKRTLPFGPARREWDHRIDGAKILLVEDNLLNQIVARSMLTQSGAAVDVLENGLKAVERMAEDTDYDLVLMDVQMPVMDGCTATRKIREELGLSLPILAMTAGVLASERAQCTASGMNDFIPKPIDVDQMFSTIIRYLPMREVQKASAATRYSTHDLDSSNATGTFDPHVILNVGDGDIAYREQIIDLIRKTIAQSPIQFVAAKLAWKSGNWEEAASILHSMRSPLGMLGATHFSKTTIAVEEAWSCGADDVADSLFEIAEQSLESTVTEARQWLSQLGTSPEAGTENTSKDSVQA
jgi:PAS domain S-box-containing protein